MPAFGPIYFRMRLRSLACSAGVLLALCRGIGPSFFNAVCCWWPLRWLLGGYHIQNAAEALSLLRRGPPGLMS